MCAESDFFYSYSAPVFQKLTPDPGMTPDYAKFITPPFQLLSEIA